MSVKWALHRRPLPVIIDKVQIQQVVFNLVRNSIEAMAEVGLPHDLLVGTRLADGTMAEGLRQRQRARTCVERAGAALPAFYHHQS